MKLAMGYTLLKQYTVLPLQPSMEPKAGVQYIGIGGQVPWLDFNDEVQHHQEACQSGETIKVIYLQRHGHGEHNPMPENPMPHWSRLKGLHQPNKIDPALSQIGEEQMSHLSLKLETEVEQGLPPPSKVYTSITKRTCQSAITVWRPILPLVPIMALQELRDTLEGRGFSKRGPLSDIKRLFPGIIIPTETTETDELWDELGGIETSDHLRERVESAFDKVWDLAIADDSIVAHKDVCDSIYMNLFKMEEPDFQTAEMRVIFVKQSV